MIYIIECTLWIWGFYALFQEPFILYKLGDWMRYLLPKFITKPLFDCMVCMASVHGTLFYVIFVRGTLIEWVVFCVSVCGLSFILREYLYE